MLSDVEYLLSTRLIPYLKDMREFWQQVTGINTMITGEHKFKGDIYYRVTNTPNRSPIKNIQVFPFVSTANLGIGSSGYQQTLAKICCENKFRIEEFTIIVKSGIPTMFQRGQWLAFIPTDVLEKAQDIGTWVFLTKEEMRNLCITEGVYASIKQKVIRFF